MMRSASAVLLSLALVSTSAVPVALAQGVAQWQTGAGASTYPLQHRDKNGGWVTIGTVDSAAHTFSPNISTLTLPAGAAAANIGALGGVLSGTLPAPGFASNPAFSGRLDAGSVALGASGVVGNGLTDNTATLNAALATAAIAGGGEIRLPCGVYRAGALSATIAANQRLSLTGAGSTCTFLQFSAGGGLTITYGDSTSAATVGGFTFLTASAGADKAISLLQTAANVSPAHSGTTYIYDVVGKGSVSTNYWGTCAYVAGVSNIEFDAVVCDAYNRQGIGISVNGGSWAFSGNTTSGSTAITGVPSISGLAAGQFVTGAGMPGAVKIAAISGSSAPYTVTLTAAATATGSGVSLASGLYGVSYKIRNARLLNLNTGFFYGDWVQGVWIDTSDFVGSLIGIDTHPSPVGELDMLWVRGNEFGYETRDIRLSGKISDILISHNQIADEESGSYAGIQVNGAVFRYVISDNVFFSTNGTGANAIDLEATAFAGPNLIRNNSFFGFQNAIAAGAYDHKVSISGSDFRSNTNDYSFAVGVTGMRIDDPTLRAVASLPSCSAGLDGSLLRVNDALAPTYLSTLIGGGAVRALALCDGNAAAWKAH